MDANDLFPDSEYLKSADIGDGEMTLTIKAVGRKEYDNNGKKEVKGLLSFAETEKKFTTNVTNTNTIIAMYGGKNIDTAWLGKPVTLYVDHNVKGPNGIVDGIRIRNISGVEARSAAFWAKVAECFLSPEEGRAILKEHNGDFSAAILSEKLHTEF